MKLLNLIILSIIICYSGRVSTQSVIRFEKITSSSIDDVKYQEHYKKYSLGFLDLATANKLILSNDQLTIEIDGQSYAFSLAANDLRPPQYKLRTLTKQGVTDLPRTENKTFAGKTQDGEHDVRITSDAHFFSAMIEQASDVLYIEPARKIVPTAAEGTVVIYWDSDRIKDGKEGKCGVDDSHSVNPKDEEISQQEGGNRSTSGTCKEIEIAIANDYSMFERYGSVGAVEAHNLSVLNLIRLKFDDEFPFEIYHKLVEIFVVTDPLDDPWSPTTSSDTLLDEFSSWGPIGFENSHDVASLWTARDFDGGTIGLAWVSGICISNHGYNVLQDFSTNQTALMSLQAHELGHNYGAGHSAPGYIMSSGITDPPATTWATMSISEINNRLSIVNCLQECQSHGQSVGIGTYAPDASAALDITSTTQGILVPRMTTAKRTSISSPAQGLLVFDKTSNSFWFRNSNSWVELVDSVSSEVKRSGPNTIYMGLTDNVGIGTDTPQVKLQVRTTDEQYGISHTNGNVDLATWTSNTRGGEIGTRSNHPFRLFANDGFNQFVLMPNGNVGLGLAATDFPLSFAATTGDKISFVGGQAGNHYGIGMAPSLLQIHTAVSNSDIGFGYGSSANFIELMRIKGNGNVGIGIHPTNRVDIQSGSARSGSHPFGLPLYITGDIGSATNGFEIRHTNSFEGIGLGYNTVYATGSSANQTLGLASRGTGSLLFTTNAITRAWITGEGRMGIGVSDPQATLVVARGAGSNGTVHILGTQASSHFNFSTEEHTIIRGGKAGSHVMLNDLGGLGNVGIGTSNPIQKLHVAGNAYIRDSIGIGISAPHGQLQFSNSTINRKMVLYELANNDHQFIGMGVNPNVLRYQTSSTTTDHVFYAAASGALSNELMRIKGNGYVGIGTALPDQLFSVSNKIGINSNGTISFKNEVVTLMHMYTGVSSASKMVLAHSPLFPDWGLQYEGATNKFRFLKDSAQVMAVDLGANNVEINGSLKIGYVHVISDPVSIPGLSWGAATCNCPAGTVVISGGFNWNVSIGEMNKSYPNTSTSWYASAYNADIVSHNLTAYAICARLAN